jgi:hypothetical protein
LKFIGRKKGLNKGFKGKFGRRGLFNWVFGF